MTFSRFFTAFLLAVATVSAAIDYSLIPSARLPGAGGWHLGVDVGVPGGYPNRTHIVTVTGLDPTGVGDAKPALATAWAAAAAGDVLLVPPGTYYIGSQVNLTGKDNVTLRGSVDANGNPTSFLNMGATGAFYIGSGSDWNYPFPNGPFPAGGYTFTSLPAKGDTVLHLSSVTGISNTSILWLTDTNDATVPVVHDFGFVRRKRWLQKVQSVDTVNKTVTLTLPMIDRLYGADPRVWVIQTHREGIGLENFVIDANGNTSNTPVELEQCYGSWVKNCVIKNSINKHIFLNNCLQCTIEHNDLLYLKGGATPNHAGLWFDTDTAIAVIDNGIYQAFPGIEMNAMVGSVIAYNYLNYTYGKGIDTNHGPHTFMNLITGNDAPNLQCDGFFGSGGPDTVTANRFRGSDMKTVSGVGVSMMTFCVALGRFTRGYTTIGNILGRAISTDGLSFGNPNLGNAYYTGTVSLSGGGQWADMNLTGTITALTGPKNCEITFDGGNTGQLTSATTGPLHTTVGQNVQVEIWWGDMTTTYGQYFQVEAISGATATFGPNSNTSFVPNTGPSTITTLPPVGTVVRVWSGSSGFQELDLDVQTSTTMYDDFSAYLNAIRTGEALGPGQTRAIDYLFETRPYFCDSNTSAHPWPLFDTHASSPLTISATALMAADRIINGRSPVSTGNNVHVSGNVHTGVFAIPP